jgi:phosphoribosylanthranilate isomerase
VFAPGPRRVTLEQAATIVPHLPAALEKIGVFVDAIFDEIASTVEACRLTGVQLHWDAPSELPAKIRARFGPRLRILRVVHFGTEDTVRFADNPDVDAMLVDSRTDTAVGGTGQTYDWTAARRTIFEASDHLKLIAAGGLTPGNVAEAIATLHPWGVDVVSGVEAAPGRKDPAKTRAFIANARAARRG